LVVLNDHLQLTLDRPALKRECHSKTAARIKECSPKTSRSISRVSVADLPSFTQHLMLSIADKTKHEAGKALV
jgi:hypothetical protein